MVSACGWFKVDPVRTTDIGMSGRVAERGPRQKLYGFHAEWPKGSPPHYFGGYGLLVSVAFRRVPSDSVGFHRGTPTAAVGATGKSALRLRRAVGSRRFPSDKVVDR